MILAKKIQILSGMSKIIDERNSDSDFEDDQRGERKFSHMKIFLLVWVVAGNVKTCWFKGVGSQLGAQVAAGLLAEEEARLAGGAGAMEGRLKGGAGVGVGANRD